MKEGFFRFNSHIFNKKVTDDERNKLVKKLDDTEGKEKSPGESMEDTVKEMESIKKDSLIPSEVAAVKSVFDRITSMMDEYAVLYKKLEMHVEQEVLNAEARNDRVAHLEQMKAELGKQVDEILSMMRTSGYAEESSDLHEEFERLTAIRAEIETLLTPTVTEEILHIEEHLAKIMRETSVELHRLINPTDASSN